MLSTLTVDVAEQQNSQSPELKGWGLGRDEGVNADDKTWSKTPGAHSYVCSLEMGQTVFIF